MWLDCTLKYTNIIMMAGDLQIFSCDRENYPTVRKGCMMVCTRLCSYSNFLNTNWIKRWDYLIRNHSASQLYFSKIFFYFKLKRKFTWKNNFGKFNLIHCIQHWRSTRNVEPLNYLINIYQRIFIKAILGMHDWDPWQFECPGGFLMMT